MDALSRAQHRAWIEFGTATLADAWQFFNAKDRATAVVRQTALREKLQRLESALAAGPYFAGPAFGMVDAVFAPLFRYFGILDPAVAQPIFEDFSRVSVWRAALASRPSVIGTVGADYAERFRQHLREHAAIASR